MAQMQWLNPFVIVLSALGIMAMALIYGILTGVQLPFVSGYRAGFTALAIVIFAKSVLALLYRLT
ncbi:MAG: hypothetical protein HYY30_14050 [Chloroflexi bacterium]|nr:hypothetical protein [Chloroflexota bacterium]